MKITHKDDKILVSYIKDMEWDTLYQSAGEKYYLRLENDIVLHFSSDRQFPITIGSIPLEGVIPVTGEVSFTLTYTN